MNLKEKKNREDNSIYGFWNNDNKKDISRKNGEIRITSGVDSNVPVLVFKF